MCISLLGEEVPGRLLVWWSTIGNRKYKARAPSPGLLLHAKWPRMISMHKSTALSVPSHLISYLKQPSADVICESFMALLGRVEQYRRKNQALHLLNFPSCSVVLHNQLTSLSFFHGSIHQLEASIHSTGDPQLPKEWSTVHHIKYCQKVQNWPAVFDVISSTDHLSHWQALVFTP